MAKIDKNHIYDKLYEGVLSEHRQEGRGNETGTLCALQYIECLSHS